MKIICVGRNYAKHAAELGNDKPTEPVLFMKPDSAVLRQRDAFYLPAFTEEVHYEVELLIRIDRLGKHIQPKFAHKYFTQVSVGIDFTARDTQSELKSKGLPGKKRKPLIKVRQ
jgi:2-keto-4-pentenoate hydratase/2-oxohepta-3-ene-1,7-dioic acid hydratase in catechol pathway